MLKSAKGLIKGNGQSRFKATRVMSFLLFAMTGLCERDRAVASLPEALGRGCVSE